MATPTRTHHRLAVEGGPIDVEVVTSAPAGRAPAVLLVGALGSAAGDHAARRLARAGFAVIVCRESDAARAPGLTGALRDGILDRVATAPVAVVGFPLAPPDDDPDAALDALVRDLAARAT